MNHKMSDGRLLNKEGNIREPGYAFSLNQIYSRDDIKASKWRIKEWDYYYIGDEEYGLGLTVDDNGYMGLSGVTFLDFKNKKYVNKAAMYWFCFGKLKMPPTSATGDAKKIGKNYSFQFFNDNGKRRLLVDFKKCIDGKDLTVDVTLFETTPHSMVIATPFFKKKHFYYNQKINLLKVVGYFKLGDEVHQFGDGAFGVLDWGRGVWTYKNTWYWASASGTSNGHNVGFNLGYGFGDTSKASENMLFIDDKAFKLNDVSFNIPVDEKGKDLYLKQWTFTSKSGDINLTFDPIIDRKDYTDVLLIASKTHQVFGRYNGTITVDGVAYKIDNVLGFAEKVRNKW